MLDPAVFEQVMCICSEYAAADLCLLDLAGGQIVEFNWSVPCIYQNLANISI